MDITWDGITRSRTLTPEHARVRHGLADAARDYDWDRVLEILRGTPDLINTSRPDGSSLYAPLHQAAHGGAPRRVVEELLDRGAFRALRNARGEWPVDVARRTGHHFLRVLLQPRFVWELPGEEILSLQLGLHEVIRSRADRWVAQEALRLPELEVLLECEPPQMWFPVPGMYGGFAFNLDTGGDRPRLVVESWCRVVSGSGQRHAITSQGWDLVGEGFV